MDNSVGTKCGVFGAVHLHEKKIFPYVYWGMRAQNHRGHQSHGFLTYDGGFHVYHGLDLIPKIKRKNLQEWLDRLPGHIGIGNVRYTTSGRMEEAALVKGTQPIKIDGSGVKLAVSFNGNVVNTVSLRRELKKDFPKFSYECDAELICRKLVKSLMAEADLKEAARTCMDEIEGAFSVCGITEDGNLFAFKDAYGLRPLCAGCSKKKDILAFSSETVGFSINGFEYDFEVEPGEFVTVNRSGFERENLSSGKKRAFCAFEFAYFARPDSKLNGKYVYEVREEFGRNLGNEYSDFVKEADVIVSLPQTSNDATYGLHEETGLRWERGTRRHRYVTERAFMLLPEERYSTIDRKINILNNNLAGKNLIIVDDSIVRGDTTRVVVEKMRNLGAKKIHLFITFPRIIGPCFYGIDMATYGELIGSTRSPEEIAQAVGADSVNYQSLEGFVSATGMKKHELCFGCVTGNYPTPLAQRLANWMRKRFENGHVEKGRIYEIDAPNLM